MDNKEVKKESQNKEPVKSDNYFITLNDIDVSNKTEKKNGLTYLSWAWAWGEIKKIHPKANYKIYETLTGCIYWTDGKTCWVKTGVIVNDIEHIEYLPVMDFKNKSILLDNITSFDVNKAIQRSLTKAVARHGLGLYIYAGEDLPNQDTTEEPKEEPKEAPKPSFDRRQALSNAQKYLGSENGFKLVELLGLEKELTNLEKFSDEQLKGWISTIRQNAKPKQ